MRASVLQLIVLFGSPVPGTDIHPDIVLIDKDKEGTSDGGRRGGPKFCVSVVDFSLMRNKDSDRTSGLWHESLPEFQSPEVN